MKVKAFGRGASVAVLLCLLVMSGCGDSFNGSLTGRDGDGTGPNPVPGQAQITSLNPSLISAASPPFTLTVTGVNFNASTTVLWNGYTLPTTYVSPTMLKAQVLVAQIASPGTVQVTPGPQQPISFSVPFTIEPAVQDGNKAYTVTAAAIHATDMVWSAPNGKLYLSTTMADPTLSSSLVALDPVTGQIGPSLKTATPPGVMDAADDGSLLYAAFNDAFTVRRYTLPGLGLDVTIPLQMGTNPNYFASDVRVQPGNGRTVAVARLTNNTSYLNQGDVVIFDDATARSQTASSGMSLQIAQLLWALDEKTIFGTEQVTAQSLYRFTVDAAGTHLQSKISTPSGLIGNLHLSAGGNLLYLDNGGIVNADTGEPAGGFPGNAISPGFVFAPKAVFDDRLKIGYLVGSFGSGSPAGTYVVEAFDLSDFHLLGSATIPNVTGAPAKLLRCGDQGLAFLTTDSTSFGPGAVYLLHGAFVTHPASQ